MTAATCTGPQRVSIVVPSTTSALDVIVVAVPAGVDPTGAAEVVVLAIAATAGGWRSIMPWERSNQVRPAAVMTMTTSTRRKVAPLSGVESFGVLVLAGH